LANPNLHEASRYRVAVDIGDDDAPIHFVHRSSRVAKR